MRKVHIDNKFAVCDRVKYIAPNAGEFLKDGKEYSVVEVNPIDKLIMLAGSLNWYDWKYFTPIPKFQAMKFRVENEEHSRKIQEHLFSLGYEWYYEGEKVKNVNAVRIYTNTSGLLGWATKSDLYNEDCSYVEYILKESTTYSLEKAPVESPITQQINIDGQALTEQDVRDLIAFKKLMQEQFEKFGGK